VRRPLGRRKPQRRWGFYLVSAAGLGAIIFLMGLKTWEIWFGVIVGYYLFWCTRMQ